MYIQLKFNILVIFTKYSIRAVPKWSTCQCFCLCTIWSCFCYESSIRANLRRQPADFVVSNAQTISFFMKFHLLF